MKKITSRHNPWIKRFREAIRDHDSEIAIEGPKAVRDAIAAGWKPIVIATREGDAGLELDPTGIVELSPPLFDSLAETRTPQGTIGLFERPRFAPPLADRSRLVVALDGVQDPGNVGTIIRLCAAFDVGEILLLDGSADAYGPKAIRASAGAILTVPAHRMSAEALTASEWPLFAAAGDGEVIDPPARGAVIVFGNEGAGVSPLIASRARKIAIGTTGRVESLNVASSAAILLSRSFSLRASA